QCGDLQVQEAVRGSAEQRQREVRGGRSAEGIAGNVGRQVHELRVRVADRRADLAGLRTHRAVVAADGHVVAAADLVAWDAALLTTQVGRAELDAQRA